MAQKQSSAPETFSFEDAAPESFTFEDAAPQPDQFSFEDAQNGGAQRGVAPPAPGPSPSTPAIPGALDRYLTTAGKNVFEIPEYVGQGQHAALMDIVEQAKPADTLVGEIGKGITRAPYMAIDAMTFLTKPIFGPIAKGISGLTNEVISPEAAETSLMALGPKGGLAKPAPRGTAPPPGPPAASPGTAAPPAATGPAGASVADYPKHYSDGRPIYSDQGDAIYYSSPPPEGLRPLAARRGPAVSAPIPAPKPPLVGQPATKVVPRDVSGDLTKYSPAAQKGQIAVLDKKLARAEEALRELQATPTVDRTIESNLGESIAAWRAERDALAGLDTEMGEAVVTATPAKKGRGKKAVAPQTFSFENAARPAGNQPGAGSSPTQAIMNPASAPTQAPAAGATPPPPPGLTPPGAPPLGGGGGAAPPGGPITPPSPPGGRPPFAGPATNPRPLPPSILEGSKAIAKKIEQVVSPTTVDEPAQFGDALVRERRGVNLREAEQVRASLDEFNNHVRAMDETQQLDFIDYMETRSVGPRTPMPPALQPIADSLRTVYQNIEAKLSALPSTDKMRFITDYFPHFWDDPNAVNAFISKRGATGKEGSGGFTKARDIPTIAEGLANGLRLKSTNPLDATMQYVENAYRFIAQGEVFEKAKSLDMAKYYQPGKQPDGWVELSGRFGGKLTPGGQMRAYAPEGFARVYNNAISREMTGPHGDIVRGIQQISNWATGLELGFSGFHAMTMSQEAMVNAFATAAKNLAGGRPIAAVKNVLGAPFTPVADALVGGKMQRAYLNQPAKGPVQRFGDAVTPAAAKINRMVDLMTRAGGKAVKMDRAYLAARQDNYISAIRRGTMKTELAADWRDIKGRPVTGTASVVARHFARAVDTFSAPMFQQWIPKLKQGAFYKQMEAWMERNPGAAEGDQLVAAREIWDSVDNRYGEMVRDNLFWDNRIKQAMQIALRSFTWTLGSAREIAGGAWDTGKLAYKGTQEIGRVIEGKPKLPTPAQKLNAQMGGRMRVRDQAEAARYLGTKSKGDPKVTQRMAYALALPMLYAMWNGVANYMYTGEAPRDMKDLMAARTGGRDAATGRPERIVAPGYMKDVLGWSEKGFWGELYNKVATVPRTALEMSLNRDWRGLPIAPEGGVRDPQAPSWAEAMFNHMLDNLGPFGVKQIARGQKRGSAISPAATFLGFQPANRALTDPEGYERMKDRSHNKDWRRKTRADRRDAQRYQGPAD